MDKTEKIIILIFGKRGSGKSVLAKKTVRDKKRLLIYDSMGEYTDGVIVQDLNQLRDYWGKVYRGNFRIIYQPVDPVCDFNSVCCEVCLCEDLTFLVEEIALYSKPLTLSPEFLEVIQRGRHHRIELIGTSQRPNCIDRMLTSQAKQMCIFNTTEPRDIEYFKSTIGYEAVKKIAALEQYEYVNYRDGIDELEVKKENL